MAPNRVDFVNEHDAGRILLGLLEHVAHAAGAHAHEHLDEIRTGNREEGHIGLAGDRAGKQSLAGSWGTYEKNAFRNAAAEPLKFLRVAEELDDFLQLLLGLVNTGYIFKRHPAGALGKKLGPALAESHRLAAARLHLAQEENPHADQKQHREPVDDNAKKRRHAVVSGLYVDRNVVSEETLCQLGVIRGVSRERLAVGELVLDLLALDRDFLDGALDHFLIEFGVIGRGGLGPVRRALKHVEQENEKDRDDDPEQEIAKVIHESPFLRSVRTRAPNPKRLHRNFIARCQPVKR